MSTSSTERFDEAIAQLREAVAVDSHRPAMIAYAHDLLAGELTGQGKTDEAIAHLGTSSACLPSRL